MKTNIRTALTAFVSLLLILSLAACNQTEEQLDKLEKKLDERLDAIENIAHSSFYGNVQSDIAADRGNSSKGKADVRQNSVSQTIPDKQTESDIGITANEAKSIALSHAGLNADEVSRLHCELDFDNGVRCYEVNFYLGGFEYEYDIGASSGEILAFEKDD